MILHNIMYLTIINVKQSTSCNRGQFPESTMDEVKPMATEKPSAKKRRVKIPAKDLEAFRAFQKARNSQHDSPVLE